jgi:hypothetical protein
LVKFDWSRSAQPTTDEELTELISTREKLNSGRIATMDEARRASDLWEEARVAGKKGDARYEYVRERMGRPQEADPGWLAAENGQGTREEWKVKD